LSGHAANWGDLTPAAFIDWGHAVAASAWGGGLVCSWWCVFRETHGPLAHADLVTAAHRFSRLAEWCICVIVLSGLANAYIELATIPALWTSPYGRLLAVKVTLVLGTLGLGATNRYRVLPALGRSGLPGQGMRQSSDGDVARMLLSRYVAREAILVVAVFGCTAVLGQLPPPRQGGGSHDGMVHAMAAD
jgi:putative copper export protein